MRIPPWIALRFLLAQLTRISNLEQANIFLDFSSTVTTFRPREANHGDVAYHPDIICFSHSIISVIFLKILDQSRIFTGSGLTVAMLRSLDSPRSTSSRVTNSEWACGNRARQDGRSYKYQTRRAPWRPQKRSNECHNQLVRVVGAPQKAIRVVNWGADIDCGMANGVWLGWEPKIVETMKTKQSTKGGSKMDQQKPHFKFQSMGLNK